MSPHFATLAGNAGIRPLPSVWARTLAFIDVLRPGLLVEIGGAPSVFAAGRVREIVCRAPSCAGETDMADRSARPAPSPAQCPTPCRRPPALASVTHPDGRAAPKVH